MVNEGGTAQIAARQNVVARARAALARARSKPIVYKLGRGGLFNPGPADSKNMCDCSGFIAWVYQFARNPAQSKGKRDFWIQTDMIVGDATKGGPKSTFVRIAEPVAGCAIVYPKQSKKGYGHIGLITDAVRCRGIDVASGPSKRNGNAISERDLTWMKSKKGWCFVIPRHLL